MIFRLSAMAAVLLIAPGAALAQAVCNPAPSTGAGTNTVSFDDAAYAAGIDCDTGGGDMTVGVTSGGVDIGGPGILLDGTGADGVAFNSALEIDGVDVIGALLDIKTGTGDIGVSAGALDADQSGFAAMTHGLRAISAGGNIDIVLTGTLDADGGSSHVAGQSGIEARGTSGNGSIDITTGSVSGHLRGIHAQANGSGTLTINTNGTVSTNTSTSNGGIGQIAAIDATTDTGLMTLNLNSTVNGSMGNAVRAVAGGDMVINVAGTVEAIAGADAQGLNAPGSLDPTSEEWVMDLTADGEITLNNSGTIRSDNSNIDSSTWDDLALRASGGSMQINNSDGDIRGRVDFSGMTGGVEFDNADSVGFSQGWKTTGDSVFSAGDDVLSASNSILVGGFPGRGRVEIPSSWDFGDGDDAVELRAGGMMILGPQGFFLGAEGAGKLTITNLEAFENAGTIAMGAGGRGPQLSSGTTASTLDSDRGANERLMMIGGSYTGTGDARIVMDVSFRGGPGQDACVISTVGSVADCLYFPEVTTSGSTLLTLRDSASDSDYGSYLGDGIVLVDAAGGSSAAEHFTLDPNSDNVLTEGPNAGMMERGYFLYALGYDEDAVQHRLVSLPNTQVTEFSVLPQAVQAIWHTSTGLSLDRQADLRDAEEGAGVWLRLDNEEADRDLVQTFTHRLGPSVSFDNSYEQESMHLTGGIDMAGEVADGEYAIGGMLGYVESDLGYDQSATQVHYKGGTIGVYGGYGRGPFRLDAAINGVVLATKIDGPDVGLPDGLINRDMVRAVGVQAETSWRFGGNSLFLEPVAGFSHVSTHFDRISLEQAKLNYDDPTSTRAGLGLRLGGETALSELSALRFDLAAKFWEELSGENTMIVDTDGISDLSIVDEFTGTFTEVSSSASLAVANGLSLFVRLSGTFGDDYEASAGSAGFRYQW